MSHDVIVLGAGMVGVSAALHLQQRGLQVLLVDRRGPAEETSYGNAGLIQSEGVVPYTFPRDLKVILGTALGQRTDARMHWAAIPKLAPALIAFWRNGTPERIRQTAEAFRPLAAQCVAEHEALISDAGVSALMRRSGYLKVFRHARDLDADATEQARQLRDYGVRFDVLDRAALAALEPHLSDELAGAVHLPDPVSISDPGRLGKAYAELFARRGGQFALGEATTFMVEAGGYSVLTGQGRQTAQQAVIALGPWSGDLVSTLGYRLPLFVKRGYHVHYRSTGNASLGRPVVDHDYGYVLAPMSRGIRLTTGAEFALRDALPSPVQLDSVEPTARALFPLADRVEPAPWMGNRPCLPDMLPVIGPAPRHKGLWFDFAHQHWGFTYGPVSGRLLAEMMTGQTPFTDPAPYRAERF